MTVEWKRAVGVDGPSPGWTLGVRLLAEGGVVVAEGLWVVR